MVPASVPVPAFARTRPLKSASAFRTISEVADHLDVPQHVLRFWETRFTQIRPLKRAGGRRYYRPEDVELLRRIRELLYRDGYTIKGVQKLLRDNARDQLDAGEEATDANAPAADTLVVNGSQSAVDGVSDAREAPRRTQQAVRPHRALDALITELEAIRAEIDALRGR